MLGYYGAFGQLPDVTLVSPVNATRKMNIEIKGLFPILSVEHDEDLQNFLNDLLRNSGKLKLPLEIVDVFPLFTVVSSRELDPYPDSLGKSEKILSIEISTEMNENSYEIDLNDISVNKQDFTSILVSSIFRERVTNFLTLIQLANPGVLNLGPGVILKNGKHFATKSELKSIFSEKSFREDIKWPELQTIPVFQVWSWLIKNTNILEDFSSSNIERGINAFTYLFSDNYLNDLPKTLFWSIIGLESLYSEGDIGIGTQINQKAQEFLGEIRENKRILKKMYSLRSSLLHGSLDIPINNGWINSDKIDEEIYKTGHFAGLVLTSTLQQIIKHNLSEFKFEFRLRTEEKRHNKG
ncbi:MAG: hypothetical protein Roseis2KO_34060 [Roseivirga sp.]